MPRFPSLFPLRRGLRAIAPGLVAACAVLAAAASSAVAAVPTTTSVWGYSGLVVMPTAAVHGFRDFSLGLNTLSYNGMPRLVPYATAGVFEGLEVGVLYGVPVANFSGLSGHAKYQLIRPTRDRPTSVAVGVSLVGVTGGDRYVDGNNVYMVLSQDFNTTIANQTYTLATGHFGFAGNLSLGSRLMGGVEIPVTERGAIVADYLGPMSGVGGFFNLGASWRPLREWQVRLYTMGTPGGAPLDRDYGLGISYSGNILGNRIEVGNQPGPRPTSRPPVGPTLPPVAVTQLPSPSFDATPAPLPSLPPNPSPLPTPTALPTEPPERLPGVAASERPFAVDATPGPNGRVASLRGTLLDGRGRPLAGWSVGVPSVNTFVTTDTQGLYTISLPLGPYDLTVRDPLGKTFLTKPIRLVTPAGMVLPLVVSQPVGQIKGTVVDRGGKQGLADATIQLFHGGETYNLASRLDGAFYLDDLPEGDYRIVVTRSHYQPYQGSLTIVSQQERHLLVPMLARAGALSGQVVSLSGQGQPGVVVRIPALKQTTTTDRSGHYVFKDLTPGNYEVVFSQGSRTISATRARIRPDETTTDNVRTAPASPANKAGTIAGQIVDAGTRRPLGGVKLVVEGGDLTVLTISSGDGHFTVSDLPPGRYKVTASKAGYRAKLASASVTAKAGATVNLAISH